MERSAVWIDVTASDAGRSREFYGRLFGWRIDVVPERGDGPVESGPDGQRVGLRGP
jgi:predicted enzyme related to lactoylglutathione lyase